MILLPYSEFHIAFWSIAVAVVCAVSCALLGCYLVLKRMSMLCDAIGHGVLPGIALAALITGQRNSVSILIGAMVFGVLTAVLAQSLTALGRVPEDAALGTVFTSLFAVGVILLSKFLGHVDLDPNCVLYGDITMVPLRTSDWLGLEIPDAFPTMFLSLVLTLLFITLFAKELQVASFDPGLATAMGYNAQLLHYLLVGLVAVNTVSAFEAVGSVVVLAMFVVPAATAQMLTDRLRPMVLWAALVALVSALGGYFLAKEVRNSNIAGMIAATAGFQLLLAVLFAPRHGILAKVVRNFRLSLRMAGEEILAALYRAEEAGRQRGPDAGALALEPKDHGFTPWVILWAKRRLLRHGMIAKTASGPWALTEKGQHEAASIVRAHRLWEAFLGQNFDLPLDHLHAPASRIEHFLGPELQTELAKELDQPAVDPHGKSIPRG